MEGVGAESGDGGGDVGPGSSGVSGFDETIGPAAAPGVDDGGVFGIDDEGGPVVALAEKEVGCGGELGPVDAAVGAGPGAGEISVAVGGEGGVDDLGIGRGECDARPSEGGCGGKAAAGQCPVGAAIVGDIDTVARDSAGHGGQKVLGIVAVDLDVGVGRGGAERGGGGVVPGGSPIDAFPDSCSARDDVLSDGGDGGVDDVGVGGIDGDLGDGFLVEGTVALESPGGAAVRALEDAASVEGEKGVVGFAGAGVDNAGVGGGDGDSAGEEGGLGVGEGGPGGSTVNGLPYTAAGGAGVDDVGAGGVGGERGDAAAAAVIEPGGADGGPDGIAQRDQRVDGRLNGLGSAEKEPVLEGVYLKAGLFQTGIAGALSRNKRRARSGHFHASSGM